MTPRGPAVPLLTLCFAALLLNRVSCQDWKAQYIGLAPAEGQCQRSLTWLKVQWRNNTVDGALINDVDKTDADARSKLGAFLDIEFDDGTPELTCRLNPMEDRLICLSRRYPETRDGVIVGGAPVEGWCCADSLTIFYKDGRPQQHIDITNTLRESLLSNGEVNPDEARTINPSHSLTLEWTEEEGLTALVTFEYNSTRLSTFDAFGNYVMGKDWGLARFRLDFASNGDAVGASVIPTNIGANAFLAFRNIGTLSNNTEDNIFKIQYAITDICHRRALITGAVRFTDMKTGYRVIAYNHLYERSTTIISDPWRNDGPVEILQRFGTPLVLDPATGLPPADGRPGYLFMGVNEQRDGVLVGNSFNVWHTTYPSARVDTITMFNNGDTNDVYLGDLPETQNARVFEFSVNLVRESSLSYPPTVAVFRTEYRVVTLDFWNEYMGGARPLEVGLYAVTSGKLGSTGFTGLKLADARGGIIEKSITLSNLCLDAVYDPFIFMETEPDSYLTRLGQSDPPRSMFFSSYRRGSMGGQ